MKIRSFTIAGLSAVLSILAAPLHAEGDAAAGKNKNAMCAGCHGIPGFRTAYPETYHVPKLGGQNAGYIVNALKAYKAGEKNPDAAVSAMADIVGGTMADDKGKAQARAVLDVTLGILYSANNKDKRLGFNVPGDWDSMLALMKQYNDLKTDQPATAFYTNDFVP